MRKFLVVNFFCLFVAACGGDGGGGGGDLAPPRPITNANGYAVDAVIEGGTVTVYSWENGVKGAILGTAVTDENGYYDISLQSGAQPILLELTGGAYTEEASGRRISLKVDQVLRAVVNYGGDDISIMVTPYTNLATALATFYIEKAGYNVENAITSAISEVTGTTVFNILTEYPVNITLPESQTDNLTDGHMYGFFCAALSSWMAAVSEDNGTTIHSTYNSIYLAQLMYQDLVYDGVLNGYGQLASGRPGNILVGSTVLDSQAYRLQIGHHIIIAASADYNATGLTVEDVLTQAEQFSQRVNALFGFVDPLPLDNEGPTVYQTEPIGQQYRGTIDYSFRMVDPVGIDIIAVSIDGDYLPSAISPAATDETVTVTINTDAYDDGDHILQIEASDLLGNQSINELAVTINNSGILLNLNETPSVTNAAAVEISGSYETTGTAIESITVNDSPATIQQANNTFSALFVLLNGTNTIETVATDNIGNETSVTRIVDCDRVSPEIETGDDHGYHQFYIGEGEVTRLVLQDENPGYPLYFTYETTSLNGVPVNKIDLLTAGIPFFIFTIDDPEDNGVLTQVEDLSVQMTYYRPGADPTSRTLTPTEDDADTFIIPLVTEYLGDDFYQSDEDDIHTITVRVTDQAGNATAKIFTFKVFVETGALTINSLNTQSAINVYAFDSATRGGIIATSQTDNDGAAVLKIFSEDRPILIELTGGSYIETGTGSRVQLTAGQYLSAVVNYAGENMSVSISPLTRVAEALTTFSAGSYATTQEAITAANTTLSDIYGVDIVGANIIDIGDATHAAAVASESHRHSFILAGLSLWTRSAAEQNGAYSQQFFNSILLAERMAADIANDGSLNGGQMFGSVAIDSNVYQAGFGQSIMDAINSYRNMTQLGVDDHIGSGINASDAGDEIAALDVGFEQRSTTLNREVLSTEYRLQNTQDKNLLVNFTNTGPQSNCTHTFYDAVRIHTIQENRAYSYRARWATSYASGPEYADWVWISNYEEYETGQWHTRNLSPTEGITSSHYSDSLPNSYTQDWYNFMSVTAGDVYMSSYPAVLGVQFQAFVDFRINGADGQHASSKVMYSYLQDLVIAGEYPIDVLVGYRDENWIGVLRPRYESETLSPEIQRSFSATYETIDGPRNEITANNSNIHALSARMEFENGFGGPATTLMGYYVIPPGGTLVVRKYINTPNIGLYSGGEPSYTATTFDQGLTYVIDKSISVNYMIGEDVASITQMPIYSMAYSANRTYPITR